MRSLVSLYPGRVAPFDAFAKTRTAQPTQFSRNWIVGAMTNRLPYAIW